MYEEVCLSDILAEKVFIGESPKNEITVFGEHFKGNSILLHISGKQYIFIGQNIFSFEAYNKISQYVSPMGNSDVPYPYAMDEEIMYYLMIENVVLNIPLKNIGDPYGYYYDKFVITSESHRYNISTGEVIHQKIFIKNFMEIERFYIGEESYTLTYYTNPEENYERLERFDDFGDGIKVRKTDGKIYPLTKEGYVEIIERYGKESGFFPIKDKKILHKRIW